MTNEQSPARHQKELLFFISRGSRSLSLPPLKVLEDGQAIFSLPSGTRLSVPCYFKAPKNSIQLLLNNIQGSGHDRFCGREIPSLPTLWVK
eukprot:g16317.t1